METLPFPGSLIDARALARLLGVSYASIKLWGAQGRLDAYRIRVGARFRYDPARVAETLKTGRFADAAR